MPSIGACVRSGLRALRPACGQACERARVFMACKGWHGAQVAARSLLRRRRQKAKHEQAGRDRTGAIKTHPVHEIGLIAARIDALVRVCGLTGNSRCSIERAWSALLPPSIIGLAFRSSRRTEGCAWS